MRFNLSEKILLRNICLHFAKPRGSAEHLGNTDSDGIRIQKIND
jgi:hypothetical protein